MEEENKSVFEKTEAMPAEEAKEVLAVEEQVKEAAPSEDDDFIVGELSETETHEFILAEEDVGQVFEIESVELLKPITRNVDGPVEPLESNGNKFYQTKLKITYKGNSYASYVPNIKWYLGLKDGKKTLDPWFRLKMEEEDLTDNFTPEITKVYFRFCKKFGFELGKLNRKDFVAQLTGKKVKLINTSGKYQGNKWNRIDVAEFIE